jgi:hypothetical protein
VFDPKGRRRQLSLHGEKWRLWRLTDNELDELSLHAESVEGCPDWYERGFGRRFRFCSGFVFLEEVFGTSSQRFDDHKGSFSYPMLVMSAEHQGAGYLLLIRDIKGSVNYHMAHLVHAACPGGSNSSDESSACDVVPFLDDLYDYLASGARRVQRRAQTDIEPFYRCVPGILLTYGYDGECFFEDQHRCHEDFDAARQKLKNAFPPPSPWELVAEITSVSPTDK